MNVPVRQYWNLLVRYLASQRPAALGLAVLLLSGIGLQLANPQIMRAFLDTAQAGGSPTTLMQLALAFLAVALAQQAAIVGATYLGENVAWTATNALRGELADHCLHLDMYFHKAHKPGELIERIDGDVTALSNFFSQFFIQVVGNGLLLAGVLALLVREDWRVGATVGVFSVGALVVLARLRNIAVPHWAAQRQASAELFGFLEERLAGTEEIRANAAEAHVMRGFYVHMRELLGRSLKAGLMVNLMLNSSILLFALATAAAFAVGAQRYYAGALTIGSVYIVFHYTNMLERPINHIVRQLQDLQKAGASIVRVQALLTVENRLPPPERAADGGLPGHSLGSGPLAVTFDHVSFDYHDEDASSPAEAVLPETAGPPGDGGAALLEGAPGPVLRDINFHLAPGRVLGLLGRTGSGKTTITRLLFRLYDPDRGAVCLSATEHPSAIAQPPAPLSEDGSPLAPGIPPLVEEVCPSEPGPPPPTGRSGSAAPADLRTLPLSLLRRRVGLVTQNIQLFHATVRDNLTFFDRSVPDERIMEVLRDLGLEDWVRGLPAGLDTVLESGGGGLSAGEGQLLAFTRIFLQDPGLVILDEASSRLDPATEALLEHAVDRLLQGRTAILIAHRLGTVQRADEILILEGGRLEEHGVRVELARDPDSRFAQLLRTGMEEVLA